MYYFKQIVFYLLLNYTVISVARGIQSSHSFYLQDENNEVTGSFRKHVLESHIHGNRSLDSFYVMFGHPYDADANILQSHSYTYLTHLLKTLEYPVKGCTINTDLGNVDQYQYRKKQPKQVHLNLEQKKRVEDMIKEEGEVLAPTHKPPDAAKRAAVFEQIADDLQLEGVEANDIKAHLEKIVLDDADTETDTQVKDTLREYYKSADWSHDFGEKSGWTYENPSAIRSRDYRILGMIAHSWDDCIQGSDTCLHILQIRNYGPYFGNNVTVKQMKPLIKWLENRAIKYTHAPVIIVMQEFNDHLYDLMGEIGGVISYHCPYSQLIAFTLVHNHATDTILHNFCPKDAPPIGCINFGEFTPRDYLLIHLRNGERRPKAMYKIHVKDDKTSIATQIMTDNRECM